MLQKTLDEDKNYFNSLLLIKETNLPMYLMLCAGCSITSQVAAGLPSQLVSNREVETAGIHVLTINKKLVFL